MFLPTLCQRGKSPLADDTSGIPAAAGPQNTNSVAAARGGFAAGPEDKEASSFSPGKATNFAGDPEEETAADGGAASSSRPLTFPLTSPIACRKWLSAPCKRA